MKLTKLKGDIAEQAVTLKALKQGWEVLKPIGDRLPYDLVFDVNGSLIKVQVKSAWFDQRKKTTLLIIEEQKPIAGSWCVLSIARMTLISL